MIEPLEETADTGESFESLETRYSCTCKSYKLYAF